MNANELWQRYTRYLCRCPSLGLSLDVSRMDFHDGFFHTMAPAMQSAYDAMARLEAGEIANPDEQRMVGHYWLRSPLKAPSQAIGQEIQKLVADVKSFAAEVHAKVIVPPHAPRFTDVLLIGIGGSALGPQLISDALGDAAGPAGMRRDRMRLHFFDNTDPDGFDRLLTTLRPRLKSTLVLVISKSGGTPETRNGMLEAADYFQRNGHEFAKHAVAVTGVDSQLDRHAREQHWLARFPMWDWVGGRTSVTSAVGLLPAALQGVDIQALLDGAAEMDEITRQTVTPKNPAAMLALMWHHATNGRGEKDMVVLPYKDRLLLLSRYLQQLAMESLGKETDLEGKVVHQGIAVYGNKGSTDQHAYVQQLRDGLNNFFATFLVVLQDRAPGRLRAKKPRVQVEPDVTSGDYLSGFWQGTRQALYDAGRMSMTVTIEQLNARTLGALIALYERAVGYYARLVNINAYHQPGVEAGKKAAAAVLSVQAKVLARMQAQPEPATSDEIAQAIGEAERVETVHHILEHLAANQRGVVQSRGKYRYKV